MAEIMLREGSGFRPYCPFPVETRQQGDVYGSNEYIFTIEAVGEGVTHNSMPFSIAMYLYQRTE